MLQWAKMVTNERMKQQGVGRSQGVLPISSTYYGEDHGITVMLNLHKPKYVKYVKCRTLSTTLLLCIVMSE